MKETVQNLKNFQLDNKLDELKNRNLKSYHGFYPKVFSLRII